MTDSAVDIVQQMRRELIAHQAKVARLAAQHAGHRCLLGSYLEGYADAVGAMTEALTGALTDNLTRDDAP